MLQQWTAEINRMCDLMQLPDAAGACGAGAAGAAGAEKKAAEAGEEMLSLDTVVIESAMCPRVDVLPDVFHPNVALYSSTMPCNNNAHLSLFASTILFEFCQHRDRIRRFTFIHLMKTVDVRTALLLDDALYRQLLCDHRLSFLAEGHSPKVHVYQGKGWLRLWDEFLGCKNAQEQIREDEDMGMDQQVWSTVLSALHRREQNIPENPYYVANNNMIELPRLDASFQDWMKSRGTDGDVWIQHHSQFGFRMRAWPICVLPLARALCADSTEEPNDPAFCSLQLVQQAALELGPNSTWTFFVARQSGGMLDR